MAVAVADRLRAETEEELSALRKAHKDVEGELAAVQQRQKETDTQLVTLRGELTESKQRLATLTQAQVKPETQAPGQDPERPNGEPASTPDLTGVTQRGRAGHRLERERLESRTPNELTKDVVSEEERADRKSVSKRYLRNLNNEDRSVEEVRSSETRSSETQRTLTSERSR